MRRRRDLPTTFLIAAVAVMLAGMPILAGHASVSAAGCQSWGGQPANVGSDQNTLRAVAVVSPCRAWAVGGYTDATATERGLVERWDGSAWRVQSHPQPGPNGNYLLGVAATSASNAWAVGYATSGSVTHSLIEHWNGTAWKVQQSPNPGADQNELWAVTARSAGDAWAVGYSWTSGSPNRTLVLHWNGHTWRTVTSPNVGSGDNALLGVSATSGHNAWAVGRYFDVAANHDRPLILHWNGTAWKVRKSPAVVADGEAELHSVAATSGGNAWAVGTIYDTPQHSLIFHWDGTRWRAQRGLTFADGATLDGVAATSATNAWAVGSKGDGGGGLDGLMLHWDGHAWRTQKSPSAGRDTQFDGVDASSSSNAWAVGFMRDPSINRTFAAHCC